MNAEFRIDGDADIQQNLYSKLKILGKIGVGKGKAQSQAAMYKVCAPAEDPSRRKGPGDGVLCGGSGKSRIVICRLGPVW